METEREHHRISGDERLKSVRPSISCMFDSIDAYIERYHRPGQPDLPYFYNERATLSLLAGGVWRSNPQNLVLEEYGSPKECAEGSYRGRFDFWCQAEGQTVYAEAKQVWPVLSTFSAEAAEGIIATLNAEAEAARRNCQADLTSGAINHACGIVFVVPWLSWRSRAQAEDLLADFNRILTAALATYTEATGAALLRGTYYRPDLLAEEHYYQSSAFKSWGTLPLLEVLIASLGSIPAAAVPADG